MTTEEAEKYLSTGANLIVDAQSIGALERLARTALTFTAHLTIVGELEVESMLRVAEVGGRYVTFDTTSHRVGH